MVNRSDRKAVLITGGAIRLGKTIALHFASIGYDVAIHYRSSNKEASQTVKEITNLGVKSKKFKLDLANSGKLESLVKDVTKHFPNLSVLINSASFYKSGRILQTDLETFTTLHKVNVVAPFFLTKAFAKYCRNGSIINILDNKIGFNQFHYSAYLLSRKFVADLVKIAALEFAPGIRVNGIAPGIILPGETRNSEYKSWRLKSIPLGRQGDAINVIQAINYLLSNTYVTGQILFVDGGETIRHLGQNDLLFDERYK